MARYGIPYQGSKSSIADEIIAALPSGNRFVDLFGGGFAISECALRSHKWKKVLYNDINPLTVQLVKDAIDGKYSYKNFTPEWISREEFFKRKDIDGYVKWCWSFGNDGHTYLYGRDIEDEKHKGHDFCVYGKPIDRLDIQTDKNDITSRRLALNTFTTLEHLQRLERIQNLEYLQTPEYAQRLQMTCMDYRGYKYQDGDVVYCDIPYQNSAYVHRKDHMYQIDFDYGTFYSWAISRPYPVYFSSYKLGGIVWEQDKNVLKCKDSNSIVRREVLYCVDNDFQEPEKSYQGMLFERVL